MIRKGWIVAFILGGGLSAGGPDLLARTIAVPSDYPSIKAAVRAARDGDIVEVGDGHYLESEIVLDKKITLRSKNLFGAVICGRVVDMESRSSALIRVRNEVLIEGFVLKYGFDGIVQRDSPDVLWRARDLAFLDLEGVAISINDRHERIGRAEVERIYFYHCQAALDTNDAESLKANKIVAGHCGALIRFSNQRVYDVDEVLAWDFKYLAHPLVNPTPSILAAHGIRFRPRILVLGEDNPDGFPRAVSADRMAGLVEEFMKEPSAREPSSSRRRALSYLIKGDLFASQGDSNRALTWHKEAASLAASSGLKELHWRAEFGRALALDALGDSEEAGNSFRRALDIAADIRAGTNEFYFRLSFRKGNRDLLESYLDCLYRRTSETTEPKSARRALEAVDGFKSLADDSSRKGLVFTERGRRALQDISRIQRRFRSIALTEYDRESLRIALGEAETRLADFFGERRRVQERRKSRTGDEPLPLEKLQASLDENKEAALEYFVGPNSSYGFYIDGRSVLFKKLAPSQRVKAAVKGFLSYKQVENREFSDGFEGGAELFSIILDPFARELSRNAERLHIIPDDLLHYLPFEALVWPSDGKESRHRFLLETHEVTYGSSLCRRLDSPGTRSSGRPELELLAVGNSRSPVEDGRRAHLRISMPPLRYGAAEAQAVARGFKEKKKILINREATESLFKAAAAKPLRFLHIAAHGIADDREWWRSALVFCDESDGEEDGLLSPHEIALMNLDVDLVVLSACRTSRGLMQQGSGIMGFVNAFLAAGARAVIASSWNVDDRATARFMKVFYRNLSSGMKPAASLRRAKMEFLKTRYRHPFYWAPFLLTGNRIW